MAAKKKSVFKKFDKEDVADKKKGIFSAKEEKAETKGKAKPFMKKK